MRQDGSQIEQRAFSNWTRVYLGGDRPWFVYPLYNRHAGLLCPRGEHWA
jgi:hypothetical protein